MQNDEMVIVKIKKPRLLTCCLIYATSLNNNKTFINSKLVFNTIKKKTR